MKKQLIYLLFLLILASKLIAGEYDLKNVPQDFWGTYLPVDYIELLHTYKNHNKALMETAATHYDILRLEENRCYSTILYANGYAVLAEDFGKWLFTTKGNDKFITDENGYEYLRISKVSSENAACEYVASYIFGLYPEANVIVKDDTVKVNDKLYTIELNPAQKNADDSALRLSIFDSKGLDFSKIDIFDPNAEMPELHAYFVFLEQDGFKIVNGENVNDLWWEPLEDEIVFSFND